MPLLTSCKLELSHFKNICPRDIKIRHKREQFIRLLMTIDNENEKSKRLSTTKTSPSAAKSSTSAKKYSEAEQSKK